MNLINTNENIYVTEGDSASNETALTCEKYDILKDEWTKMADLSLGYIIKTGALFNNDKV